MESEKVKEIKKALECMSGLCKDSLTDICFNCEVDKKFDEESVCKEALTLINELESENERLSKELETRKEEVLHLQEYGKKLIRETELKQFAESLKEKAYPFPCAIGTEYAIPYCKIDETLKEYENELI